MRIIPDLSETRRLCPPQIHTLNSHPQCDVGLWKAISHEGGSLMSRISAVVQRPFAPYSS